MQAQTYTPASIFGHHVRYVVPLFQRTYRWNQDDQWAPLWEDVRQVTERLLESQEQPTTHQVAPHFLGAIVLDQQLIPSGFIGVRSIVDGQQRLTTLQILLDAAQHVVAKHGQPMDAQALRILVVNDPAIAQHPDEVFKVWPTDRDQEAFRAVMDDNVEPTGELAIAGVVEAHTFFVEAISDWALVDGDIDERHQRLHALTVALRDQLKLVVIDLEPGDNAQVIFESLNYRGARLLAADLMKNLLFQQAMNQGADHAAVRQLYDRYWHNFDEDWWLKEVRQGRLNRPRIDMFMQYWLTMKLHKEVAADRIYDDFRKLTLSPPAPPVVKLMAEMNADAKTWEKLEEAPPSSVEGTFRDRILRALDSTVVAPFLLGFSGGPMRTCRPSSDTALCAPWRAGWCVARSAG